MPRKSRATTDPSGLDRLRASVPNPGDSWYSHEKDLHGMISKESLVAPSSAADAGLGDGRVSQALRARRVFRTSWPVPVIVAALVGTFLVANREIASGR